MEARIQKWGNSLALRIPKSFAVESRLERNTVVDIRVQNGTLVVTPVAPRWTLDELLAQVTDENSHAEQVLGPDVGKEIW